MPRVEPDRSPPPLPVRLLCLCDGEANGDDDGDNLNVGTVTSCGLSPAKAVLAAID